MKTLSIALVGSVLLIGADGLTMRAQQNGLDPSLCSGLHWRMIGPFRGGGQTMTQPLVVKPDPRTK